MAGFESKIKTIEWADNCSRMVDQTVVPYEFKYVDIKTGQQMYDAIQTMVVRGAPAIGIAGAHGVALYAQELAGKNLKREEFISKLIEGSKYLASSRPTAVNLRWAIEKQLELVKSCRCEEEQSDDEAIQKIVKKLIQNGVKLENEDIEINKKIGDFGAQVVPKGATILTHCNAGALATVGYGTALGVVRSAYATDNTIQVFADETRPRQQGARITTFELVMDKIPVTLITDGMCSYFMKKGMIDMVVVGADRIAANGDTANKIGTYTVAIAANYHNIPFYIAAPLSTIDISIKSGEEIPIEERDHEEVTHINGKSICAEGTRVINPAFDVTPNELITGIITEVGILKTDYKISIAKAFKK
ncbi:MAG TPA: S-methyl-5-thioribose-1-phosphate isomerase [Candidatus Gastranaerophilaceae bacterium]|nr:S-methyl-5-thioribose-1-phosphate isomerase [Candidatus Gastranaerophilaceae bacterium]